MKKIIEVEVEKVSKSIITIKIKTAGAQYLSAVSLGKDIEKYEDTIVDAIISSIEGAEIDASSVEKVMNKAVERVESYFSTPKEMMNPLRKPFGGLSAKAFSESEERQCEDEETKAMKELEKALRENFSSELVEILERVLK